MRPKFKRIVVRYREIHIFKTIPRAEMFYNNEESEGTQQQRNRILEYRKKEMPPSNNLRQLAFLRRSTAKSYQETRIDGWEHLTRLTAI